jgi:hypothetical protein
MRKGIVVNEFQLNIGPKKRMVVSPFVGCCVILENTQQLEDAIRFFCDKGKPSRINAPKTKKQFRNTSQWHDIC